MAASEDPRHAGEAGPGAGSSSGSPASSGPSDGGLDEEHHHEEAGPGAGSSSGSPASSGPSDGGLEGEQAGSMPSDGPGEERLKSSSPSPGPASSTASASSGAEVDELAQGESEDPLDVVTRERDELRETVQRVQADFENFRKRMMRDQAVHVERATAEFVEQVLPVLDSFELAVLNIPEHELDDAARKLKKGVELVYAELLGVLEKNGLERLDAQGKPFDPEEHEAVMREGEGEPVVMEVMRTGYRLKGRILRPAMVKVGPAGASG